MVYEPLEGHEKTEQDYKSRLNEVKKTLKKLCGENVKGAMDRLFFYELKIIQLHNLNLRDINEALWFNE